MPIKVRDVGKKLVFRIKRLLFVCNERRLFDQLPKEHMTLEGKHHVHSVVKSYAQS